MQSARDAHHDDLMCLKRILTMRSNTVEGMVLVLDNALETVEIMLRTVETMKKLDESR